MRAALGNDWVPFHKRLAKGPKKSIRRGVRFVLLELSLEARSTRGVLDLPLDWDTLDAVHDLLGGDRKEIRVALEIFQIPDSTGEQVLQIERDESRHRLKILKWEEWAGPKSSAERVADHRARKKNAALGDDVTLPGVLLGNGSNAYRTGQDKTVQDKPSEGVTRGVVGELARAYADGIAEASGEPWRMPDANVEAPVVLSVVQFHKPQLRGPAIAEWVKRSAATYRRVMGEGAKFQRGFRPSKWSEWLNAGQPGGSNGPVRATSQRAVQPDSDVIQPPAKVFT